MRDLRELFHLTGGFRRFTILLILRCPFDAFHTFVQANFLYYAFNVVNQNSLPDLYLTCLLYGVGCFLLFLYNGTVWIFYAAFFTKWTAAIRGKLFGHVSRLSLKQIEGKLSGDWITRLNADVYSATAVIGQPLHLPHAACGAVNLSVSSIVLFLMNPEVYGLSMLFIIPQVLISRFFIAKPMPGLYRKSLENTAQNTVDMNALITCADTAILYDAQEFLLHNFEKSSLRLRKINMKMRRRFALQNGVMPVFGLGGYLIILLIGGIWISAGEITFGGLTAAFQYRGDILTGAMMLSASLMNIRASLAGAKRLNETMQISLEE
jgi:ABC-type multidrug transport system fused ATPase/permease subunit